MKLITRFELVSRRTCELRMLYHEVFNAVARTMPGSDEQRIGLASLANIRAEIARRGPRLP